MISTRGGKIVPTRLANTSSSGPAALTSVPITEVSVGIPENEGGNGQKARKIGVVMPP